MEINMEITVSDLRPEKSFSPSLPPPDIAGSGSKQPFPTEQRMNLPDSQNTNDLNDSHPSKSPRPSGRELETDGNGEACDSMVEKWRLIRHADKVISQKKKIYPANNVYAAPFGQNYSKFYDAFQQGITPPRAPKPTAATVPGKRPAAALQQASKRRRTIQGASPPRSDQHQARTTPTQRSAATVAKTSIGPKSNESPLSSNAARESPVTPRPMSSSEAKEKSSRRKGVGLYAGNWEYITDEEKEPEYMSVVQKTADFEGRTTRRAYAKITSKEGPGDPDQYVRLPSENEVRKSGRARNAVDYTRLSGSEEDSREIATSERTTEGDIPSSQATRHILTSTSASSTSKSSTSVPGHLSKLVSTSAARNTEHTERPKLSWNAIVYDILATSDTPLTFPQIVQRIRDRYPFFNSPSQEKVLESGPKNPLYFHDAFDKDAIINGKQTWALLPGEFVDKKTGNVLTPQPRYTISSAKLPEQPPARQIDEQQTQSSGKVQASPPKTNENQTQSESRVTPGPPLSFSHSAQDDSSTDSTSSGTHSDSTSSASEPPNPSNAVIISDQDSIDDNSTSVDRLAALDDSLASLKGTVVPSGDLLEPTASHRLADAADAPSAIAVTGTSLSGQTPPSRFQCVTKDGSPVTIASTTHSPLVGDTKSQETQNLLSAIDHEVSAIAATQTLNAIPAAQQRTWNVTSPSGDGVHGTSSTITHVESATAPMVLIHALSPSHVSQTPRITSVAPTSSTIHLAGTPFDGLQSDDMAGDKEVHTYPRMDER